MRRPFRGCTVRKISGKDPSQQVFHFECEHGYSPSTGAVVLSLYSTKCTRSARGSSEIVFACQVKPCFSASLRALLRTSIAVAGSFARCSCSLTVLPYTSKIGHSTGTSWQRERN